MTRSKNTQKINHNNVVNSAFIENLDDYLLTQILFRLPSCASVLACKPVNKRWCSLISDPRFAALFSDHKMRNPTLLKSDDEEPPWTYLVSMDKYIPPTFEPELNCVGNASTNEAVFGSTKFNLEYLPCRFYVEAMFRDLVLCSDVETCLEGCGQIYYITNPLTKQWVALPPSPVFEDEWGLKPLAAFLYQQPHDYTQDYQFRVVLIDKKSPPVYELLVYCSEIGEWKKINLHVQIKPELAAQKSLYNFKFQVVVCDGVIFLYHKLGFAAFNPFDVDETTNNSTVIEAKLLPSLHVNGFLLESSGNLYFIYTPKERRYSFVCYKKNGSAIEMALKVWKLNPNQVPLKWEATFDGTCSGNLNRVVQAPLNNDINFSSNVFHVGMHPRDDKLIYMHLRIEEQFISCDTRSRLIMPLKSLPHCSVWRMHRLEIQWWPTSIPKTRSSATLFSKYSYYVTSFLYKIVRYLFSRFVCQD